MDLWSPPHDAPHLLEWWRPLMLVSRRARAERFPWPVHVDEFRLAGRVRRQGRPDIWIYDHHDNGGSVCVDAAGQTYKFVATPRAKGVGQFRTCPLRTALWRARLPDVVEPVRYERPQRGWDAAAWAEGGGAPAGAAGPGAGADQGLAPSLDYGYSDDGDGVDGEDDARDANGTDGTPGTDGTGGVDRTGAGAGGGKARRVISRGHLTLVAG